MVWTLPLTKRQCPFIAYEVVSLRQQAEPGLVPPSDERLSETFRVRTECMWSDPMKAQLVASACALIVSAYGITPAAAESFNDRGLDWTMASPMPTAAHASNPLTLPPDGSFASSWGSGKTPSQSEGPSSSSARLTTGRSCDPTPRFGFNDTTTFPTC